MKLLCWNCQGLGKAQAVWSFGRDVTHLGPDFIFLCETRLRTQSSAFLKSVLGYESCFFVDSGPGCTGLAIFWNNKIKVDLLSYSPLHIDVVISYDSSSFRFTGMHGRSESTLKKHNWALIDHLRDASPLPWVLGGDFNEILSLSEKQGGSQKPYHQLTDFRECLLRNDFADCKPSRGWFTWMQSGPRISPIRERLDRFVACKDWFSRFPGFRVWSEFSPNSDHHFILLDTVVDPAPYGPHRWRSTFRFDACWALEPDCITLVHDLWAHSAGTEDLEALLAAKGELRHLLNVQEDYWAQRSRVLWLSAGDRNTSFFHAKASARRQKNAIPSLHDAQGHWRTSTSDVLRIASDYFMELFSAGPSVEISAFLEHISPSVTEDMNSVLTADFTTEDILGDDFVSLCLDLLRGCADMASVNETVIVLIPKVDNPTSMRTQAAFVQGHAITDNILVAHELVHTLHTLVSRSSQGSVFKLDMEKAFDRVEWPFLKVVMLRLGFAQPWVDLIMRCVSSVSSRVRLRGTLSEAFLPGRGLRQGDPLSPFLFLFCTEGLSAALTAAQHEGRLPGVRASKNGPPVNHLLFADDSLVFLRNDLSEVHYLKDILSTYSAVSGQKVNFSKSTAYFSPRTPPQYRVAVHEALGVQEVSDPGIYLGVPILIGKNKYAAFGHYRDKMDTRVSKWSNLLLSFSGHEVLIKSIAQALPQYVMSCYLLPCSLVEEMSRSIRRFWWSGKGSIRGWPFLAWADLCQPKVAGGMGFKCWSKPKDQS
ncbi:hypothetical protein GQ457_03G016680 [Hibiscus cannabinus]